MVFQSRMVFRDETDFFKKLSNMPGVWQKDGWKGCSNCLLKPISTDFGY